MRSTETEGAAKRSPLAVDLELVAGPRRVRIGLRARVRQAATSPAGEAPSVSFADSSPSGGSIC